MTETKTHNSSLADYTDEELSAWEEVCFLNEEKYITRIYVALIGIIAANQLLEFVLPSTFIRIIELGFFVFITSSFFRMYRLKALVRFEGWPKILCVLIVLCLIQILIRGNWQELSLKDLPLYILNRIFCLPYLLPFCVLFLPNSDHVKRISSIFYWGTLFVIPMWIIHFDSLIGETFEGESIGAYLPFLGCFLLAYPTELPTRRKIVLWSIWGTYLLLMLLNARRNMIFSLCFYAFIGYYVNIGKHIGSTMLRFFLNGLAVLIVALSLLLNFSTITGSYFQRLNDRINEDSRSGVELLFWADYLTSTPMEQAFGKGAYGSYYQEMTNKETGETTTDRFVIETGYLNMLLKGGYVFMAIIIIVMLTCFVKSLRIQWLEGLYLRLAFILFAIDCYTLDLICMFTTQSVIFWLSVNLALDYWPKYSEEADEDYNELEGLSRHPISAS